jgi:hypothetical protein
VLNERFEKLWIGSKIDVGEGRIALPVIELKHAPGVSEVLRHQIEKERPPFGRERRLVEESEQLWKLVLDKIRHKVAPSGI